MRSSETQLSLEGATVLVGTTRSSRRRCGGPWAEGKEQTYSTVRIHGPTGAGSTRPQSLRVTTLLSVLGLVWRREGKGTGAWHSQSVLALVQLRGSEKIPKLENCLENGLKHKVLLDRK